MSQEELKVLEMVAEGKISPEEGVRLLEALSEREPGPRARHGRGIEFPDVRLPRIDLGQLGEVCVELKNTVVEGAKKAHGHFKRSRAGRYFELKDYPLSVAKSEGIERCKLNLSMRAGKLRLKGGPLEGMLLVGKARLVPEEPVIHTEVREKQIEVTLRHSMGRCEATASDDLVYRVNVDNAAADSRMALEELKVEELVVDNNAGSMRISLGEKVSHVEIDLRNNAGSLRLQVPGTHAVRVTPTGSLSSHNLDKYGLEVVDGAASSNDWEANNKRVDILLSQNVAHFRLDWQRSDGVRVGAEDEKQAE